jgi:hypothetical protein
VEFVFDVVAGRWEEKSSLGDLEIEIGSLRYGCGDIKI